MDVDRLILRALSFEEWRRIFPGCKTAENAMAQQEALAARRSSEPDRSIIHRQRLALFPRWTGELREIIGRLQNHATGECRRLGIVENLAQPLVDYASKKLWPSDNVDPLLSRAALDALRRCLLTRLSFTARQAVDWNWKAFLTTPGLREVAGGQDDDALRKFYFRDGVEPETLRLLRRYPALARLWTAQVNSWLGFMAQFLAHAAEFAAKSRHPKLSTPLRIQTLVCDLSDLHSGNRAVMRVRFAKLGEWYYKPRSGRNEAAWFDLMQEINAGGFAPPFAIVPIECGTDHCWMKAVRHRGCRSQKEARAYFTQAGALVCLIHYLRGVDFHAANFVGRSSNLVAIDCETLMHPAGSLPVQFEQEDDSLLRTGMLPIQKFAKPGWDSVTLLGRATPGPYSARLHGKALSATRFGGEVVAGYGAMHNQLSRKSGRASSRRRTLSRLRHLRWRRILRPTAFYAAALSESLAPGPLRSGIARSLCLRTSCHEGSLNATALRRELSALERADIPIFYQRSHERSTAGDLADAIAVLRETLREEAALQCASTLGVPLD